MDSKFVILEGRRAGHVFPLSAISLPASLQESSRTVIDSLLGFGLLLPHTHAPPVVRVCGSPGGEASGRHSPPEETELTRHDTRHTTHDEAKRLPPVVQASRKEGSKDRRSAPLLEVVLRGGVRLTPSPFYSRDTIPVSSAASFGRERTTSFATGKRSTAGTVEGVSLNFVD